MSEDLENMLIIEIENIISNIIIKNNNESLDDSL